MKQTVLLLIAALAGCVRAICTNNTYWNPLNNACVNGTYAITKSVRGRHPPCTTPTPRPTSA